MSGASRTAGNDVWHLRLRSAPLIRSDCESTRMNRRRGRWHVGGLAPLACSRMISVRLISEYDRQGGASRIAMNYPAASNLRSM